METQHTALPEAAPLPLPPSQEPQGLGVKKSGDGGRYKERFLLLKKKTKEGDVSLSLQSSVMIAIIQVKCYSLPCVNFLIVTKSLRPHGLYSTTGTWSLLSPGSAMPASRHTTHTRTKTTACSVLTALPAAVMGHAQMGVLLLRESGDSPRIRQTEGKSTAQDFWNSIQDSSVLPCPSPYPSAGIQERGPTLSSLTSQVSTSIYLCRGSSESSSPWWPRPA